MTTDQVSKAYDEFKLSITRAMADQLADALKKLEPAPLTKENVGALAARPGVYELYLNDKLVYVGKASKDLPGRLADHVRKLSGRAGIKLADVSFQCLYVDEDLEAAAPEKMLINRYKAVDELPWNDNGFGNNDPGRNRDHSLVKFKHFDALYPVDLNVNVATGLEPGERSVTKCLEAAKAVLPFNFRYDDKALTSRKASVQYTIEIPDHALSARELIQKSVAALPEGWQATVLPGYAIMYWEDATYKSARLYWRKRDGVVVETPGDNLRDRKGKVVEEEASEE